MTRCPHCKKPILEGLEQIAFNLALKQASLGGVTNRELVSFTRCSSKVATQALMKLLKGGAVVRQHDGGQQYRYRALEEL